MSSMNLGSATVKVVAFLLWEAPAFCCVCVKVRNCVFLRLLYIFSIAQ